MRKLGRMWARKCRKKNFWVKGPPRGLHLGEITLWIQHMQDPRDLAGIQRTEMLSQEKREMPSTFPGIALSHRFAGEYNI